jgi:selenocysteine lyase/cysteine desulfurase
MSDEQSPGPGLLGRGLFGTEFAPPAWRVYANTANYGLPPIRTVRALEQALAEWSDGSADWSTDWDPAGDACRALVAPILGAPAEEIALLPTVSAGVGLVAAGLTERDVVLVPDDEFRSVLFPLLAGAELRGARVRRVPFEALAASVDEATTLVATSHVRSNGGAVQDLAAVADAARAHGARILVDATHAAGILPVEAERLGLDYVVCAAYKHLLCPRGAAFMRVAAPRRADLPPLTASWRSVEEPYASFYGGTTGDLASTGARFDQSLAWHAWVGARESLELLASIDPAVRERWCTALAASLADRLGLASTGSSMLGIPIAGGVEAARRCLREASVAASFPGGLLRVSFHVYNDETDVEYLEPVLAPLVG